MRLCHLVFQCPPKQPRRHVQLGSVQQGAIVMSGTSSGIGQHAAIHLASFYNVKVYCGVRKLKDFEKIHHALKRIQRESFAEAILLDVTCPDHIQKAVEKISQQGLPLVGVIANAGVPCIGSVESLTLSTIQDTWHVNCYGAIALLKSFLPQLLLHSGRIIVVSSVSGEVASPIHGAYASSKFALEALCDALRAEQSHQNVAVSIIQPGAISTPIWKKAQDHHAVSEKEGHWTEFMKHYSTAGHAGQIGPEYTTLALEHALTASFPLTRYRVGFDAHLLLLARPWIPDYIFDQLALKAFAQKRPKSD